MTSNRSYLLKALYEWVLDNDCTPYIVINTESGEVLIPEGYAEDNQIVLNIAPGAVRDLEISQSSVYFQSRFSGIAHDISAPVGSVVAIFAKETGEGMVFDLEDAAAEKSAAGLDKEGSAEDLAAKSAGIKEVITDNKVEDEAGSSRTSGSHLRVVK